MKRNSKTLRTITALAIIAIVFVGFLTNLGIGTISAPGIWDISILCPLGALGTMLASKMMVPRAVISLVIMVMLIIVFARAFCGWMCPVPLVQKLRGVITKPEKQAKAEKAKAAKQADENDGKRIPRRIFDGNSFFSDEGKSGDLRRIPLDRLRKTLGYRVCEKRRSYSVRRAAGLKIRVHRSAARRSGIYS